MLASRLCTPMDGGPRATPPASMGLVRECFDRCGGVAARAFYVIGKIYNDLSCFISCTVLGNYILGQEMLEECAVAKSNLGKTKTNFPMHLFKLN